MHAFRTIGPREGQRRERRSFPYDDSPVRLRWQAPADCLSRLGDAIIRRNQEACERTIVRRRSANGTQPVDRIAFEKEVTTQRAPVPCRHISHACPMPTWQPKRPKWWRERSAARLPQLNHRSEALVCEGVRSLFLDIAALDRLCFGKAKTNSV